MKAFPLLLAFALMVPMAAGAPKTKPAPRRPAPVKPAPAKPAPAKPAPAKPPYHADSASPTKKVVGNGEEWLFFVTAYNDTPYEAKMGTLYVEFDDYTLGQAEPGAHGMNPGDPVRLPVVGPHRINCDFYTVEMESVAIRKPTNVKLVLHFGAKRRVIPVEVMKG